MRRLLLSIMMLVTAAASYGQSRELSISLSSYKLQSSEYCYVNGGQELVECEEFSRLFNMSFGYYFPLFTPDPNLSIGANATLVGGLRYHSS